MRLPAGSSVLVIYNARAGGKTHEQFAELLEQKSKQYEFEFRVYEMENQDCEGNIRKEIKDYHPDLLIAAGGDGTLNIVAKIAPDYQLPVMILPCGSANGMARELAIPNQITAAYDVLENYKIKPVDLLTINNSTCVHLADVGLNARIVKRFEEDPRRGLSTYARYLWREIFLIRSKSFQIRYDGKSIRRRAVSITFANASKYGTGAVINPTGKIDDGRFELCIVKLFPWMKIFSLTWKMFRGNLQTSEYFEVISCKKAHITTKRGVVLQVDGEVIGQVKHIDISITPLALKLLLPAVS
ncbi:diacylglycerol/lipid kinase family protein [Mucilaginibacter arboris]|uniref:Diacylglycerol kinase n=1 Tax=Mucilaginibacter arboris TaxID=2682090 RepID=A0A7K1SXA4_9SPHI|nr:diacylglycerol kinase family protein [Mucilaginibacter arboris]MVN21961.1 diacylglycerol kinase [Mucilaginibacter arboris]